mmetsp:Transcript_111769/g.356698  ORF Transcript_111769/g.356698 Transcript_111769/m.356698 type:complete len:333 (+) Transcript_111769:875-1873(+)
MMATNCRAENCPSCWNANLHKRRRSALRVIPSFEKVVSTSTRSLVLNSSNESQIRSRTISVSSGSRTPQRRNASRSAMQQIGSNSCSCRIASPRTNMTAAPGPEGMLGRGGAAPNPAPSRSTPRRAAGTSRTPRAASANASIVRLRGENAFSRTTAACAARSAMIRSSGEAAWKRAAASAARARALESQCSRREASAPTSTLKRPSAAIRSRAWPLAASLPSERRAASRTSASAPSFATAKLRTSPGVLIERSRSMTARPPETSLCSRAIAWCGSAQRSQCIQVGILTGRSDRRRWRHAPCAAPHGRRSCANIAWSGRHSRAAGRLPGTKHP